jgi:hypothetical protein
MSSNQVEYAVKLGHKEEQALLHFYFTYMTIEAGTCYPIDFNRKITHKELRTAIKKTDRNISNEGFMNTLKSVVMGIQNPVVETELVFKPKTKEEKRKEEQLARLKEKQARRMQNINSLPLTERRMGFVK